MNDFVIMTDSCCDLDQQMIKHLDLSVVPLHVQLGDVEQNCDEIDIKAFYDGMRQGAAPKTAAGSIGDFTQAMASILEQEKDLLYVCFSGALSTTYQSAVIAADDMKTAYPDRTIHVLDSRCASMGQGLLLYLAVQEKKKGKTLLQVKEYIEDTIPHLCHWFSVDDLTYLKRTGRVSGASAFFGTMLGIKPVLHVDDEGRLVCVEKRRGRKAAVQALAERLEQQGLAPLSEQTVFISHADCEKDAQELSQEIQQRFGIKTVLINYIGPVIGSHSGPGTLSVFFLGTKR